MVRSLKTTLEDIIQKFAGKKVAVIGDLVADEYIYGESQRISREAPIVILKHSHDSVVLGGAANAANNIASLGGTVFPVGMLGCDYYGSAIIEAFKQGGVDTRYIVSVPECKTVSKTRVLGCGHHTSYQQLVRVDRDNEAKITKKTEEQILANINSVIKTVDAVIVSDYNHGVLSSEKVTSLINSLATSGEVPIMVDSRFDLLKFKSFFSATPNETEVEDVISLTLKNDEDVEAAAHRLLEETGGQSILITRGNKGMCLLQRGKKARFIEIYGEDEIADVTGAGDTVISTMSLGIAAGASLMESTYLANIAGGLVVMKNGTATISNSELLAAVRGLKQ